MSEKRGVAERFLSGYIEQGEIMNINSRQKGIKYRAANVAAFVAMVGGAIPAFIAQSWIAGKWVARGAKKDDDPIKDIDREARHYANTRPDGRVLHLNKRT